MWGDRQFRITSQDCLRLDKSSKSGLCLSILCINTLLLFIPQDMNFIFNHRAYVLSCRSWRTVWTRLSQGEIHCDFEFSLNSHTDCWSENNHLWLVLPGTLPQAGDRLGLQARSQPTPTLSHAAFVGSVYHHLRPTH